MTGEIKKEQRPERYKNSYSKRDFWLYYNRNRPNGIPWITESEYSKIYNAIFTKVAESIAHGNLIKLPYIGYLQPFKLPYKVELKGGKLVTNRPIDWHKTHELWRNDKQAEKQHILIRYEDNWKVGVTFTYLNHNKNMKYLQLRLNETLLTTLSKNFKNGIADLPNLKRYG